MLATLRRDKKDAERHEKLMLHLAETLQGQLIYGAPGPPVQQGEPPLLEQPSRTFTCALIGPSSGLVFMGP